MSPFAESHVEEAALAWLSELGYARRTASTSARMATRRSAPAMATCCWSSACAPPSPS